MEIPLTIYSHWHSPELPPSMQDTVNKLRECNPTFSHRIFTNDMCRDFIKENFDEIILNAYDSLLPDSYKSDLWRFCMLYTHGGIYLDIKYAPVNGFSFLPLMNRENFTQDRPEHFHDKFGVYTALIICKAKNQVMYNCINKIVQNVKDRVFGFNPLYPTGPGVLSEFVPRDTIFELKFDGNTIYHNGTQILQTYPDYRLEQQLFGTHHYDTAWHEKNIYTNQLETYIRSMSNGQLSINFDEKQSTPLCEIMGRHGSDKGSINITRSWHNYTPLYFSIFKTLRERELRIFELGLGTNNINIPSNMGKDGTVGASLYGWAEFFPNSLIYGADIDKDILFNTDRIKTFYCDQTCPESITRLWNDPSLQNTFDIIIDDGLHKYEANVCFFENSIDKLNENGYYIIEDIHISDKQLYLQKIREWESKYTDCRFKLIQIPSIHNNIDNMVLVVIRGG